MYRLQLLDYAGAPKHLFGVFDEGGNMVARGHLEVRYPPTGVPEGTRMELGVVFVTASTPPA